MFYCYLPALACSYAAVVYVCTAPASAATFCIWMVPGTWTGD